MQQEAAFEFDGAGMSGETLWGIHMGRQHGDRPIEDGYIAIGWAKLGDVSRLPADREALREAVMRAYPETKERASVLYAGILHRFVHEMKEGDLVIYPSKADRMVNVGRIAGPYRHDPSGVDDPEDGSANFRSVEWHAHRPRASFPQVALNEIGSALTLFQVANNPEPFLAAMRGEEAITDEADTGEVEAASEQVEESTEDFVVKRLKTALTPERFEHFVAHLLTRMGYHARVTSFGGDGGIDIIAHRDELGFEPPVIKVQCKQTLETIGRPQVQQLMGAIEEREFGLFVTLGSYATTARDMERQKANLRLIDGATLTELMFAHYERFEPQWQTVVPLKRRYIPG